MDREKASVPECCIRALQNHEQKLGILRILDWIERHANYVHPLTDVSRIIRRFEKPDRQWDY